MENVHLDWILFLYLIAVLCTTLVYDIDIYISDLLFQCLYQSHCCRKCRPICSEDDHWYLLVYLTLYVCVCVVGGGCIHTYIYRDVHVCVCVDVCVHVCVCMCVCVC